MTTAANQTQQVTAKHSVARRLAPKLAISVALGALFAWLVVRGGVPLIPSSEAFVHVQWWAVPGYAASLVVTHLFRATRWRFLIAPVKPVPLREVIALNWIGFFVIMALPLRLGEMARPVLAKLRQDISISAGLGTVAVERVVDGVVTSLCVVWALLFVPRVKPADEFSVHLPTYGYLALAVFSAGLVALSIFLWQRDWAVRTAERSLGVFSQSMARFASAKIGSLADGLLSIADARLAAAYVVETLIYWGTNIAGMWLLGIGCGLPLSFGHAVAVMGVLAIGIVLPAGPGLFGNFQLAISLALKLYFVEAVVGSQGAVYIFLMYAVQAVFISLAGIIPLYAMKLRFRDLVQVSPDAV